MENLSPPQSLHNPSYTPDQLIDKLVHYSPVNLHSHSHSPSLPPTPLLQKFTVEQITNILDRTKIESIDKVYRSKEDGFNLLEFVRFFLNVIEHEEIETLYLAVALIDFFKEISQASGFRERLHFIDITNYICNRILEKRNQDNQIESKYIPDYRTVIPNFKIKNYLINPPLIYSSKDELVYKLSLNKIKIDKMKHEGVVTTQINFLFIRSCYFSASLMKVFTLDDLSDSISVYNTSCGLVKKIKPHFTKLKKDIVVLSFAYSERQERIGAVLKDFSINFWDQSDNFQFEKSISTASHCQQYQSSIWFFEYFNAWVTSDKTGHLYIWNLEAERPQRKIKLAFDTQINDLAVIPCINLIAVVQERRIYFEGKGSSPVAKRKKQGGQDSDFGDFTSLKDNESPVIYLYNFLKGEIATKIELGPENRNPHTLQYSQNYQVLLSAGYEKKISIFEINKTFLDTSKKGELTGHQSLITSFTVVKKSPMVISADDKGKVKIWDIRNYKCVQTLDFRDKTNITKLLDMIELGKVGVLGSRINFVQFDQKTQIQKRIHSKQKLAPLWVQCDYGAQQLIILTKKDIRIIDLRKGIVKNIYCQFHTQDIEITFFKYFQTIQKFVIGNQKGQIKLYCLRTGRLDGKLLDHMGSITHIQYDQQNKIFITMGQDGNVQVQKQQLEVRERDRREFGIGIGEGIRKKESNKKLKKIGIFNADQQRTMNITNPNISKLAIRQTPPKQPTPDNFPITLLRQMKNNFNGREITVGAISIYHGFIVVGSSLERNLYIWDYEYSKLLIEIGMPCGSSAEVTAMAFVNGYGILGVGTSEGIVYFLRINKMSQGYKIKTIGLYRSPYGEPISHITVDLLIKGFSVDREKLVHCKVFVGHGHGHVTSINLTNQMENLKQEVSVVHRQTFNPERQLRQNFTTQLQKRKYQSYTIDPTIDDSIFGQIVSSKSKSSPPSVIQTQTFQAHKSNLTGLYIIQLDQQYLVSIGQDEKIKIWNNCGLICDWNINLPLPFRWDIQIRNQQKKKDKIMFAFKIIQEIFQRYGSDISIHESKCLKVKKLLDKVKQQLTSTSQKNKFSYITEPNNEKPSLSRTPSSQSITLFQNQFTKKDLHYEDVKKFNFNEIAGPTLREIQVQKKLDMIQKEWSINKEKVEEDKNKLLMVIRNRAQKNQEKEQILQYMQPREQQSINMNVDKNRESQDSLKGASYVKSIMNQIQGLSIQKGTKKETQTNESVMLGCNKINKENYTGFSLLHNKSKLNILQPKSSRWVDQQKSPHPYPIKQKQKENQQPSRTRTPCTFQKYFEQRQKKHTKTVEDSEREMNKSCNTFREILFRMNSKVKQSKKTKLRDNLVGEQGQEKEKEKQKNKRIFAIATSNGKRRFHRFE